MKFNALILDKLDRVLDKYNLQVSEQFNNFLEFKSDNLVLMFGHDEREKVNSLYIGKNENSMFPIDDNVLEEVFNFPLKINLVPTELFADNLIIFFNEEGKLLIQGDTDALEAVRKYVYKVSEKYTIQLLENQKLDAANRAWLEKNYKDFISYLDKIDKNKLPSSYILKYNIALKKLS